MHHSPSTRRPKRAIACLLALSIAVSGCAAQSSAPMGGSAVERANANFAQTVAVGALAGAAAGALLGGIFGGGRGAGIGALAGGAAGTGAGYLVAQHNVGQAQTEDTLEGQIAAADQRAQLADAAATEARQAADQARTQSRKLMAQYRAGQISAAQYRQQLASQTQYAQSVRQLIGNMENQEARLRQQIAAAGPNSTQLRDDLVRIQASRRSLQGSLTEITAATSAAPQA